MGPKNECAGAALGAVLAGGRGSRIGGAKSMVVLGGRPLIHHPLAAIEAAGLEPIVVAKRSSELPPLVVPVIREPDLPRHPLCGIVAALRAAEGRAVVAVACDMPCTGTGLIARLGSASEQLVVPTLDGTLQPLPARYGPELLPALEAAMAGQRPLRSAIESLQPRLIDEAELVGFGDPRRLFLNVNSDADLRRAERLLAPDRPPA